MNNRRAARSLLVPFSNRRVCFQTASTGDPVHRRFSRAFAVGRRVFDDGQMLVSERRELRAAVAAMVERDHGHAKRTGEVRRAGIDAYIEIELRE